jgi:hypothetical protein
MTVERFFDLPCYGLDASQKQPLITAELALLTDRHRLACRPYRSILEAYEGSAPGSEHAPFLAVSLFKQHHLVSVPATAVFKNMTSSGTSGQSLSRIALDAETARLQTRALARIMTSFLGKQRLPMLIVDHPNTVKDRTSFSARGAGILGMMTFGRDHTFAFTGEEFDLDWESIESFSSKYAGQPVLAFGFTFMVWRHLLQALDRSGRRLPFEDAVLVHSGGWKKLEDEAVSNERFKEKAKALGGFSRVHNFYGMVEQTGSVFVECEAGHLHAPIFADVIIRDPFDWRPCEVGRPGLIQVLSVLPRSYPGHSLLTEDRGVLLGEDNCECGRKGRYFKVLGRLPQAEIRGCSDTLSQASRA